LAKVETAVAQYPNENRLLQQQATLQNLLREARNGKERAGDLGVLRELREQIGHGAPTNDLGSIFERSQAILQKYPDDPEIRPLAAEINHWTSIGAPSASSPDANSTIHIETGQPAQPPRSAATPLPAPPPVGQQATPEAARATANKAKLPSFSIKPGNGFYLAVIATVVVLIGAALVFSYLRKPRQQPLPHQTATDTPISVSIQTTPADAIVTINGEAQSGTANLSSVTTYDIVVSRPGYVTYRELGKRAAASWSFALNPEPLKLTLATSAKAGKILIDNNEKADLQGGAPQDLELPADGAQHTVTVQGATGPVLSFTVVAKPGDVPLMSDLKPKDLIAVSSLQSNLVVYTGGSGLKANLGGQPPQPIPADGLRLSLTNAADNSIVFDNKDVPKISVDAGNAPSVYIGLNADQEIAYLRFQSNVETAHLKVDGVERKPVKGVWRPLGLKPGTHSISVTADGYEPHEQQVDLTKGSITPISVQLKPIVVITTANLVIEKGTPGATVYVDGAATKTLDASGSATIEVQAGQHRISFRRQDYENSPEIARTFTAGQEMRLGESEARLKKIEVRVAAPPPVVDAVTKPTPLPPAPKAWTIDYLFQSPEQIALDGPWWKSSAVTDYVFLKAGIIRKFDLAFSDPGKNLFGKTRKVEWVLSFGREGKINYDFDGKKLTRKAVFKGKTDNDSIMCQAKPGDLQFIIAMERGKISVQPASCDEETYESTDQDLTAGQIGVKPNADFIIRKP
jgi:hypothetical protein